MSISAVFKWAYTLSDTEDGYVIRAEPTSYKNVTVSEPGGDRIVDAGGNVQLSTISTGVDAALVGHFNGGLVIQLSGNAILVTDEGRYEPGNPVPLSTSPFSLCFARGTLIATPTGEVPVEELAIGDVVLTARGTAVPVRWVGRQTQQPLLASLHHNLPIRVQAGALGDGLPRRDLFVSPDHALLVEGCLVHAAALVNGRTICRMDSWHGDVEYFHIETDRHEIILADGATAETFIDNVSRATFDNHAEFLKLYPDVAPMEELGMPRVRFARQLPSVIRRKLDGIASDLQPGWRVAV